MLIGPTGTGKTLLCQLLAEQFKGSFEVALLAGAHLNSRRVCSKRSSTSCTGRTATWTRANCAWP